MSCKVGTGRLGVVLIALFSAMPSSAADLVQVYREALAYDAQYAAARASAEAGREKQPQALAGLLPTIGVTGNTSWNDIHFGSSVGAEEQSVRPKYLQGREVTGNMRAILIDWLIQVQMKFRLLQETMYMTVSIIDRFMQNSCVPKKMLQLVGVTAMFIASKYEEMDPT